MKRRKDPKNTWVAVKDKSNPGQVKYVQRGHKKHRRKHFTAGQTRSQTPARTPVTRGRRRPTDTIADLSHMGSQEQWQIEKGGSKWTKRDSALMWMIFSWKQICICTPRHIAVQYTRKPSSTHINISTTPCPCPH